MPAPQRYSLGSQSGFNPYSAGAKQYGPSGRTAPNVGASDKTGYRERDMRLRARRNALLAQLKAMQTGNYGSPAALRPQVRRSK